MWPRAVLMLIVTVMLVVNIDADNEDPSLDNDVTERPVGLPDRKIRVCVRREKEQQKCEALSSVAYSRDVRPGLDCSVLKSNSEECMAAINDGFADVVILDAYETYRASRHYNMHAVIAENHVTDEADYYFVAVVHKNEPRFKLPRSGGLSDDDGIRTTHGPYAGMSGLNIPSSVLQSKKFVDWSCGHQMGIAINQLIPSIANYSFFIDNVRAHDMQSGKKDGFNTDEEAFQYFTSDSLKYGNISVCNLAYVKASNFQKHTDGNNNETWAADLKSEDFELVCPQGGFKPVSEYKNCYIAEIPRRAVVTSNYRSEIIVNDIKSAFLKISRIFTKEPEIFKLFAPFNGENDILFKDSASSLVVLDPTIPVHHNYNLQLDRLIAKCNSG